MLPNQSKRVSFSEANQNPFLTSANSSRGAPAANFLLFSQPHRTSLKGERLTTTSPSEHEAFPLPPSVSSGRPSVVHNVGMSPRTMSLQSASNSLCPTPTHLLGGERGPLGRSSLLNNNASDSSASAAVEVVRLRTANHRLTDEVKSLKEQIKAMEEQLAVASVVAQSIKERSAVAKEAADTSAALETRTLAAQLERLARINEQLRDQLSSERQAHELKQRELSASHDAFLLEVAAEFAALQEAHTRALDRVAVLERTQREEHAAFDAKLARLQRNNLEILEKQFEKSGGKMLHIRADKHMFGNTLLDQIDKKEHQTESEQQEGHRLCDRRPASASNVDHRRIARPPSAVRLAPQCTPPPLAPNGVDHPFSRMPRTVTTSVAAATAPNPIVFPRRTMAELLLKYQKEAARAAARGGGGGRGERGAASPSVTPRGAVQQ